MQGKSGSTLYVHPKSDVYRYKIYSHRLKNLEETDLTQSIVLEHSLKNTRALSLYESLSPLNFDQRIMQTFLDLHHKTGMENLDYCIGLKTLISRMFNTSTLNAKFIQVTELYCGEKKLSLFEQNFFPLLLVLNFLYEQGSGDNVVEVSKSALLKLLGMNYSIDNLKLIRDMLNKLLTLTIRSETSEFEESYTLINHWHVNLRDRSNYVTLRVNIPAFKLLFKDKVSFRLEILKESRINYLAKFKSRQLPKFFYPILGLLIFRASGEPLNLSCGILKRDSSKVSDLFVFLSETLASENLIRPNSSFLIKAKEYLLFTFMDSAGSTCSFKIFFK